MSASKEIQINRPESHYAEKKDPSRLSRFLGKNDNPQNRQKTIDAIVQIAAIDGTWGEDMHKEVGRTLGLRKEHSQYSFLNQMDEGKIYIGEKFEFNIRQQNPTPSKR